MPSKSVHPAVMVGASCRRKNVLGNFSHLTQAEYDSVVSSDHYSSSNRIAELITSRVVDSVASSSSSSQSTEDANEFSECCASAAMWAEALARRLNTTFVLRLMPNITDLHDLLDNGTIDMVYGSFPYDVQGNYFLTQNVEISQYVIAISRHHYNSQQKLYVDWLQIFRVYDWHIWQLLLAGVILSSVVLTIALGSDFQRPKRKSSSSSFCKVYLYTVEILIRVMLAQDTPAWVTRLPKSRLPAVVLLLFFGLFSTVFVGLYSSEVYTTMLVKRYTQPQPPFDDFASMEKTGFRLAPYNFQSSSLSKLMTNKHLDMSNDEMQAVRNIIIPQNESRNLDFDTAFNTQKLAVVIIVQSSRSIDADCDMTLMRNFKYKLVRDGVATKSALPIVYTGPLVRKGAPTAVPAAAADSELDAGKFFRAFSRQSARLHESGLRLALLQRETIINDYSLLAQNSCSPDSVFDLKLKRKNIANVKSVPEKLTLPYHLASTFALLAVGSSLAIVLLFGENLIWATSQILVIKHNAKRQQQNTNRNKPTQERCSSCRCNNC